MKPYRGTLLATAVLFAALPLFGCGDADTWEQTTEITLSAPAPEGLNEVIFTVVSPPPAEGYACETLLEYRAQGAGVDIDWRSIPGTETTRIFEVRPRGEGIMSVMARGKCNESKEDWKYSNRVDVTVTAEALPTVSSVTLTASPASVVAGSNVTFSLGVARTETCNLALRYQYSGGGFPVTTVDPAATGQFILRPPAVGTLVVTATAFCTQNPAAQVTTTTNVAVTTAAAVTITSPSAPAFAAPVNVNVPEDFSSGGASFSNGESVQYRFTATGSPTDTNPTAWGSTPSASFTWLLPSPPATPFTVQVQARCSISTGVVSAAVTSSAITVLP